MVLGFLPEGKGSIPDAAKDQQSAGGERARKSCDSEIPMVGL